MLLFWFTLPTKHMLSINICILWKRSIVIPAEKCHPRMLRKPPGDCQSPVGVHPKSVGITLVDTPRGELKPGGITISAPGVPPYFRSTRMKKRYESG